MGYEKNMSTLAYIVAAHRMRAYKKHKKII